MKIRFLRDFRGAATREEFYRAGEEVDHDNWAAICDEGAAALVDEEPEPAQPETPAPAPRGRKAPTP